jgi:hypothetical protein
MSAYSKMPFGRHEGKLIADVILRYPDFIHWWQVECNKSNYRLFETEVYRLIAFFDEKPFVVPCSGKVKGIPCTRPVTQFSLYYNSASPVFWCDECDPQGLGAGAGTLRMASGYFGALQHAEWCSPRRRSQRQVIREIAQAKGLTSKMTQEKIIRFFSEPE